MGMGQLRGGVECATQPFVCPVLMHPVRRARVRAKRAQIFEFTNCTKASSTRWLQLPGMSTTPAQHPMGCGGVLGGGGLPRGTSPRPHGALCTRFARIRRTFDSACDSHDTRRDDGHTRHQHNNQKPTKASTTTPNTWEQVGEAPSTTSLHTRAKIHRVATRFRNQMKTDFNCRELFMVHQSSGWAVGSPLQAQAFRTKWSYRRDGISIPDFPYVEANLQGDKYPDKYYET
jgi:hypothetical protein